MSDKKSSFRILPKKEDSQSMWAIAWMCFFWSTASLMIFSYFPMFLKNELGLSNTAIGIIEGVAISSAFFAKVTSGLISDYLKERKKVIMLGNILSAISKVFFALAINFHTAFFARVFGRISKGIRSAPTDALITDITNNHAQGACFGVRQTLYTVGAATGGVLAMLVFNYTQSYRFVFWIAAIPASLACIVLFFGVKQNSEKLKTLPRWCLTDIKRMPKQFWFLLLCVFLLMMARFSETFLVLRAQEVGVSVDMIPLVIILYELAHAATAWPFGRLADKINRFKLLSIGVSILITTNLIMIFVPTLSGFFFAVTICGLHLGMTQGLLSTLVASFTLPHLRGTAYAMYYLTAGVAVFLGNIIAGRSADSYGSVQGAFISGLVFASLALMALLFFMRKTEKHPSKVI